ncbi:helix-turn-helix domain-containing protein [Blautia sp. An81]|uniref:helix-turn-helix domain-containing protein n=1 Tax=Blautia sp. An81 TaxID=1965659 RepID=UPI002E8E1B8C|nr:helix-turn-helix transcriptional regulator [Blautia sp. An81]
MDYYNLLFPWLKYLCVDLKEEDMSIDYKSIGRRIKAARISLDMTQERLAEKVNLSPSHLSNIETGTTKVSLSTIVKLANALHVSVDSLLADSVVQSKAVFEQDIQTILSDCDDYEIRVIADIAAAAKKTLRKEAKLKSAWKKPGC